MRKKTAKPVARRPARSIYGSIILMALLVSSESHASEALEVILLIGSTMLTLGLVELYANVIGNRIEVRRHLTREEMLHHAMDSLYTVGAASVPLVLFGLAYFHLIRLEAAFFFSRLFMIASLFGYGVVFGKILRRNFLVCILIGLSHALFGALLIGLKAAFH